MRRQRRIEEEPVGQPNQEGYGSRHRDFVSGNEEEPSGGDGQKNEDDYSENCRE